MKKRKPATKKVSFFERMIGAYDDDDEIVEYDNEDLSDYSSEEEEYSESDDRRGIQRIGGDNGERQLSIDLINTDDKIVVNANIAGFEPNDLDIQVTREVVTITAKDCSARKDYGGDYVYQEMYWGSYSRTVVLPQEIETDSVDAEINNGILTLKLSKIDKDKKRRIRIKKN